MTMSRRSIAASGLGSAVMLVASRNRLGPRMSRRPPRRLRPFVRRRWPAIMPHSTRFVLRS